MTLSQVWSTLYATKTGIRLFIQLVESFRELLKLEAEHGTPLHYTPAIDELLEYYKKVPNYSIDYFIVQILDKIVQKAAPC